MNFKLKRINKAVVESLDVERKKYIHCFLCYYICFLLRPCDWLPLLILKIKAAMHNFNNLLSYCLPPILPLITLLLTPDSIFTKHQPPLLAPSSWPGGLFWWPSWWLHFSRFIWMNTWWVAQYNVYYVRPSDWCDPIKLHYISNTFYAGPMMLLAAANSRAAVTPCFGALQAAETD